jgi:HK97 gp10 family phage protein
MAVEPFRMEGLAGVLKTLEELPPEIVSKAGGPVRQGLREAVKMLGVEVRKNLKRIIDEPNIGGQNESTGLLLDNVRTGRARLRGQNGEAQRVYIRRKRYPPRKVDTKPRSEGGPKTNTTPQIARMLEYGTALRKPMPFIRPAFDAHKNRAVQIFETEVKRRISLVQKRLARKNRVKT